MNDMLQSISKQASKQASKQVVNDYFFSEYPKTPAIYEIGGVF